jgi:hypothetical protein
MAGGAAAKSLRPNAWSQARNLDRLSGRFGTVEWLFGSVSVSAWSDGSASDLLERALKWVKSIKKIRFILKASIVFKIQMLASA